MSRRSSRYNSYGPADLPLCGACKPPYQLNKETGLCDCKPGYGIVLRRAKYSRHRPRNKLPPGMSPYYPGGALTSGWLAVSVILNGQHLLAA
jgi:hypothetical protein